MGDPVQNNGGGEAPSHYFPPNAPNMQMLPNGAQRGQKFNAYKLIVDPAITKGALKLYRFDGVIPGDPNYPMLLVRDPRKKQKSRRMEPVFLQMPTFQIDSNYVGKIPPKEVAITNLNDNVGEAFLRDLCLKYGLVEHVQVFVHPISHRHLGFGHAVFLTPSMAKNCVDKLHGKLLWGQTVQVAYDAGAETVKKLFIEATTLKFGASKGDGRRVNRGVPAVAKLPAPLPAPPPPPLPPPPAPPPPPPPKPYSTSTSAATCTSSKLNDHVEGHPNDYGYYHPREREKDHKKQSHHDDISSVASTPSSEDHKSHSSHGSSYSSSYKGRDVIERVRRDSRDTRDDGARGYNNPSHSSRYRHALRTPASTNSSNYGYPIASTSTSTRSTSTPSACSTKTSHSTYRSQNSRPPSPKVLRVPKPELSYMNNNNNNYNPRSETRTFEECELSPKMDLDTRIKLILDGRNSGGFGKLFTEGNSVPIPGMESESDADPSPLLKRARERLSLGSACATIWDSESDEEPSKEKEASFAKKFKQSFVPVHESKAPADQQQSSRGSQNNTAVSPPPSPFLPFNTSSSSKTVKGIADPEFGQISNEEDKQLLTGVANNNDDMSLSPLSPENGQEGRIKQRNFAYSDQVSYNSYPTNYYLPPWGSHTPPAESTSSKYPGGSEQEQQQQQGYNNYDYCQSSNYYASQVAPEQFEIEEQKVESLEDHKNPTLLINALIDVAIEELRKVLLRDCNKRLIESDTYKIYEDWLLVQAQEYKKKQDEEKESSRNTAQQTDVIDVSPDSILPSLVPSMKIESTSNDCTEHGIASVGQGLRFLHIPRLPSFRRKEAPARPSEEDPKKTFLTSESDMSSSDDEEVGPRRCKPLFSSTSTTSEDDSDDASFVSSKSCVSVQPSLNSDVGNISTTEDESRFGDLPFKSQKDVPSSPKVAPVAPEVVNILSDNIASMESEAFEEEQEGSLDNCDLTGNMIIKHPSPVKYQELPPTPTGLRGRKKSKKSLDGFRPSDENQKSNDEMEHSMDNFELNVTTMCMEPPDEDETSLNQTIAKKDQMSSTLTLTLENIKSTQRAEGVLTNEKVVQEDGCTYNEPILAPPDVTIPRSRKASKKVAKVLPQTFRERNDEEIAEVIYEFLENGIDAEDVEYFRRAYELLLQDDSLSWLNSTHWADHSPTLISSKPITSFKNQAQRACEESSLRTRGFVRMTKEEKMRALAGQAPDPQAQSWINPFSSRSHKRVLMGAGKLRETYFREARSYQRRLLTALGTESDFLKFNQLQFRKKALRFARSGIHGWGLFAAEPIAANEMVIEYVGQMIRPVIADLREPKYEAEGIGSSYLFKIDFDTIIDATRCGNLSRFINHSCTPNCYAKVITIEGKKKIVIYSKQAIAVSEEITYDYKFPIEDKKIPCLCGSSQCRGTLN